MAHANWMNGRDKKKNALSGYGLWLAQWQPNAHPDPRPLAQSNPNPNPDPNLVALRSHNPLSFPKGELLNGNAPRRVFFEPARPIGGPLQLRDGITGGDLSSISISNNNNNNPNALAAGNVRDRSSKRLQRLRKVSLRERERERGAGKAPRAAAGDPDLDLGRSRRRLEGSEALTRGEWTCRAIASPLVKKPQAQAQG